MTSAADSDEPVGEPPDDDRARVRRTPPGGPETGPRPYVRFMTAIGGIGIVAAAVAVALGASTDPVLPLPEELPTLPGPAGLPSGFPTTPPTLPPAERPTGPPAGGPGRSPTDRPPGGGPSSPTGFPGLPSMPAFSLPPLGDGS